EEEQGYPFHHGFSTASWYGALAKSTSHLDLDQVSASHILVKPGRYRAPACEVHMHLPNMVGAEADMTRTRARRRIRDLNSVFVVILAAYCLSWTMKLQ
ncbi:unnamed protein product, partial [Symbiodinium sp. KB8]